jgi:hypothetical protein
VKRSPIATARRTVRRAATWRPKTRPEQPIDIAQLISPLRYDVLVRAQFFDLVLEIGEDAYEDLDLVVERAAGSPYHVWWEQVAIPRFFPWIGKDPARLAASFRERVGDSVRLHRSFRARGYDPAHPIVLRGTKSATDSDTGLRIEGRLHVGDGGHRTALLLSAGQLLDPAMCLVDWRPRPYLIDNTAILVPALGVGREDYVRFLAAGYGASATGDLDTLLADLRGRDAAAGTATAVEVAAVAAKHLGVTQAKS